MHGGDLGPVDHWTKPPMIASGPLDPYVEKPSLSETLIQENDTPVPAEILFPEYCGGFIADRHHGCAGALPPLGLYEFENCFIGYGGILISEQRKIYDASDLISPYWRKLAGAAFLRAEQKRDVDPKPPSGHDLNCRFILEGRDLAPVTFQEDELVLLLRPGSAVYGHWLLDMLPMIWLYKNCSGKYNSKAKYVISRYTPKWIFPIIELLFGLGEDRFIRFDENRAIGQCRRLIVPSMLRVSPLISSAYNGFVEHVLRLCSRRSPDSTSPKRLFISRGGVVPTAAIKRSTENVGELEMALQSKGFAIVQPEKLPWQEQVRLFASAEIVMGEFGSGLHNAVFSAPRCLNVVLSNSMMSMTQSSISAIRGQGMQYIRPSEEVRVGNSVMCRYDTSTVIECIDKIALQKK